MVLKKILSVILTVSMLSLLVPGTVMAARMDGQSFHVREAADEGAGVSDMEGLGTESAPYRIDSAEQLCSFANMVNGANGAQDTGICAVLTCDIDLSGYCGADSSSWTPIGTKANPYTGIFDGGSFVITGLYCHRTDASYAGLFGCNAGVIKNLGIAGADIAAGSYTGSVCGCNRGTITECYNASAVEGVKYTGGVCGYNDGGKINVCYNTGAVSGRKYVGGICGYNKNIMTDCYNMGAIHGESTSIGGVCGYNKAQLSGCYNTGTVYGGGKNYIGSVCGYNHSKSVFLNCYYLITGEEKGNYGVAMTREQFLSGEVCWLLNDGKTENIVWHQTCGMGFPVFAGKTVYRVERRKTEGGANEMIVAYTNVRDWQQAANNTVSGETTPSDNSADETVCGHVYGEPEWEWEGYKRARAVFTCQSCGEELTLEASVSERTEEPTCAVAGKTVYRAYVDRDGETYEDRKTVKLEKTAHQPLERVTVRPATCEESGISRECWICPVCHQYFAEQEGKTELSQKEVELPATGHKYKIQKWNWNTEKNPATATAVLCCDNAGCGWTEEKEGTVTVKTTATCTSAGETVYTAVAEYDGESFKEEKTETGKILPHSYGEPDWQWESDYSSAIATFICASCGRREVPATSITQTKTDPTCMAEGEIKYRAAVTLDGEEYETTKSKPLPKVDHSYSGPVWTWTSDHASADAVFTCVYCGTEQHVTASVTKEETPGPDCSKPGKITFTATASFDQKPYTDVYEEATQAAHDLVHVAAVAAKCVDAGNGEYWECRKCHKWFEDAAGEKTLEQIPVIPATGHKFEMVPGKQDIYECTVCHKNFKITEEPDGTTAVYSVEDNDMSIAAGEAEVESDTVSVEAEAGGADADPGDISVDVEAETVDEDVDCGDIDMDTGDTAVDTAEQAERYGLIYPEGEETDNDPAVTGVQENRVVSHQAETEDNNPARQTVREQYESSGWIPAAGMALLACAVLLFVLRRENH